MKEITLPGAAISVIANRKSFYRKKQDHWTFFACFAAVCGTFCGFVGFLLSVLAVLESNEYKRLNSRLGTAFIIAAFPLFIFAAHALDKISFYQTAEKTEKRRAIK